MDVTSATNCGCVTEQLRYRANGSLDIRLCLGLGFKSSLRIKGQRTSKGIVVETEPVRDCSGNPVPDGTIVTFTASSENTKSSVDAPIKRGIARAQMEASGAATISAASGVVMGNDLRIGAQP